MIYRILIVGEFYNLFVWIRIPRITGFTGFWLFNCWFDFVSLFVRIRMSRIKGFSGCLFVCHCWNHKIVILLPTIFIIILYILKSWLSWFRQ